MPANQCDTLLCIQTGDLIREHKGALPFGTGLTVPVSARTIDKREHWILRRHLRIGTHGNDTALFGAVFRSHQVIHAKNELYGAV